MRRDKCMRVLASLLVMRSVAGFVEARRSCAAPWNEARTLPLKRACITAEECAIEAETLLEAAARLRRQAEEEAMALQEERLDQNRMLSTECVAEWHCTVRLGHHGGGRLFLPLQDHFDEFSFSKDKTLLRLNLAGFLADGTLASVVTEGPSRPPKRVRDATWRLDTKKRQGKKRGIFELSCCIDDGPGTQADRLALRAVAMPEDDVAAIQAAAKKARTQANAAARHLETQQEKYHDATRSAANPLHRLFEYRKLFDAVAKHSVAESEATEHDLYLDMTKGSLLELGDRGRWVVARKGILLHNRPESRANLFEHVESDGWFSSQLRNKRLDDSKHRHLRA